MQNTKKSINEILSLTGQKIIGINPPVYDFSFADLWSKPMGLLYLLERLKRNGNEVFLFDSIYEGSSQLKTYGRAKIDSIEIKKPLVYQGIKRRYHRFGLDAEEIRRKLLAIGKPDAVFLTSLMTYWYGGVKEIIALTREIFYDTPIILGGIYAKLCTSHAESLEADYIVTDDWRPNVPYPAMNLYNNISYGVTMTSFGCPLSCEYCASNILWPEFHKRNISEVLGEIEMQNNLGATDFAFYDDALLLNKNAYSYPLFEKIKDRYKSSIRLHTPNGLHVREIDAQCAEILKSTNFVTLRLSLESIDTRIAKTSSDKVKWNEYESAVKNLLNAGYSTDDCETYILLGLPGQSLKSVKETIRFVRDCGGKPKLAEFSPIPGTVTFAHAVKSIPALATEPLLHNNSVYSSWISKNMKPEELQELKDLASHKV